MFAPAKTSPMVLQRLRDDLAATTALPATQQEFQAHGADAMGMSPDAFAACVRDEQAKWTKVVRDSGMRVE